LGNNVRSERAALLDQQHQAAAAVNKSLLSIDYSSALVYISFRSDLANTLDTENQESGDYLKEGDVGFKKRKVCLQPYLKFLILMLFL
jgi:U4/U6.U5 tri-snRNP-associated protein 1